MRNPVDRIEPQLAERYRKDPGDEAFLAQLNEILAPHEEAGYRELEERFPTLVVIGTPRSGTTLLNQLVCSCLDVGYVNNLIAAFWRAPVYGIRLSEKLLMRRYRSSFQSDFGRTRGIDEPHEFGYFWTSLLDYRQPMQKDRSEEAAIDWKRARKVLLNMAEAFGRPVACKSFHLGWHIARLQQELSRTCFVWICRSPIDTALSLLRLRREFVGSVETWASFRPREYVWLKERPYWEQVAGQVYYLERSIMAEVHRAGGRNVLQVAYDDLCASPSGVLARVVALLRENGRAVDITAKPPTSFEPQHFDADADVDARRVRDAVEALYAVPIDASSGARAGTGDGDQRTPPHDR